jgi:DNA-binding FadR family transcriptional regulator
VVADRIIGDIAASGWPVGDTVGSESELLDRYRVSRAVLREAVCLVEHLQVACMRRGPGGGLVVLAPSSDPVTDAVSVYLVYVGAEIDEVFEARLALEEAAVDLATARLDEQHRAELHALLTRERSGDVDDLREMHHLVATMTDNPALAFFVDLLSRATLLYLPDTVPQSKELFTNSVTAHAAIADAILGAEPGLARSRMRKHLRAEADYLRTRHPSRRRLADLPDLVGRTDKVAEQTARQIFRDVASDGWPVGAHLGSESELIERYGVSRGALREAVRVLEHHHVAAMRRGPGGGLFVLEPGVESITAGVALHVDRLGVEPRHLFEVRVAIELAVLNLAMAHLDDVALDRLEHALETERTATSSELTLTGHDLHIVLAGLTGNPVIELLVQVLVRVTRFHMAAPGEADEPIPTRDVIGVHQGLVDAVVSRDLELARHRMRRHLDALMRWIR